VDTTLEIGDALVKMASTKLNVCNFTEFSKDLHVQCFYMRNGSEHHRKYPHQDYPEPSVFIQSRGDKIELNTRVAFEETMKSQRGWLEEWRRIDDEDDEYDNDMNMVLDESVGYHH
jgi:hypothetical protein